MNADLEKLREVFLSNDVDEETRAENLAQIQAWEAALLKNEALASWKEHVITKEIIQTARESYIACALRIQDRRIPEDVRQELWHKQDAMLWLIQLASGDPKAEIERIQNDVTHALDTTN